MLTGTDVILGNIEKNTYVKFQSPDSFIFQCLTGNLHGQIFNSAVRRVLKMAVQIKGFGGGQMRFKILHSVIGINRRNYRTLRLFLRF